MVEVEVLRVFVNEHGEHGNPLGVVADGAAVPAGERQRVAAELGYSETVFVDDAERGAIRIFTPATELGFAGHPAVGAAWLLGVDALRVPPGELPVRREGDMVWVAARPEWGPEYEFVELGSAADVEAIAEPPDEDTYYWASEGGSRVRARSFPVGIGIAEDEATGSAAIRLAAMLAREVEIRQGRGSVMRARPRGDGMVEVGGRVVRDSARRLTGTGSR